MAEKERKLGMANPKLRSQRDKDEMNAFLEGSTSTE